MESKTVKWCYLSFGYSAQDEMGVPKKIKMQTKALNNIIGGCDMFFIRRNVIEIIKSESEGKIIKKSIEQKDILELVEKYDFLYYRWGGADRHFNYILKYTSKNGKINVVEVPTYPMTIADMGIVKGRFQNKDYIRAIRLFFGALYIDELLFSIQKKWVNYIVLSSLHQSVRGVDTINIINGIETESVPKRNIPEAHSNIFFMLIVANVSIWHGIDRVIEGIKRYRGKKDIRLFIVGDGEALSFLKKRVNEARLNGKVIFEGRKFGKELDTYFDRCDIAIGSLGLHRLKVKPSTLKSKEYMARGIPFLVSKAEEDSFDKSIYEYIYFAEENDEPIAIEKVINWYEKINLFMARENMRMYAESNYSWNKQMKRVVDIVYKN